MRLASLQRATAAMLRNDQTLPADVRRTAAAFMASQSITARSSLIVWQLVVSFGLTLIAVQQMRRHAALARMRTDFVSSVSHELRTPLAQVQLFLETLRLGRYNTEAERDWIFDNMQREITRLTALVNNVLQFSRIDRAGSAPRLAMQRIELSDYLPSIIDGFAPLAEVNSMQLRVSLPEGVFVSIDPDTFRQVMLNLLDNAVKYGKTGQTIAVSAHESNGTVAIKVDDEGSGIAPADMKKIWEPFERGADAERRSAVGAGIGLSVVRDIVTTHGGRVDVENLATGGARFTVTLPAVD